MKDILSVLLFCILLLLPASLVIGFSYFGNSHPLENKQIETPVFLDSTQHDLTIVFFGFVGCASICPNALTKVGAVLQSLEKKYPEKSVGAVFVDVREEASKNTAQKYGKKFSENIVGTHISKGDRAQLTRDFSLQIIPGNNKYPLLHTDHFFVLRKELKGWRITRVISNSTDTVRLKKILVNNF